jgi:hypothetical protein
MNEVAQQLQALSRQLIGQYVEEVPVVPPAADLPAAASAPEPARNAPEGAQLTVPFAPATSPVEAPPPRAGEPSTNLSPLASVSAPGVHVTASGASILGQLFGRLSTASLGKRRYLYLAPAAFLLVSGLLIAQRAKVWEPSRGSGTPLAASAGSIPSEPAAERPPVQRKQWQLASDPAGASVVRKADGKELGRTPLALDFPDPDRPLSVELRLAGFVPASIELRPEDEEQRLVHLAAEHSAPALRSPALRSPALRSPALRSPAPHAPTSRQPSPKKKERPKGGKSFFDRID